MLGKLIKYEFKATYRLFLPTYLGTILFAILAKLFTSINSLATFAGGAFMGVIIAIYVIIILMSLVLTLVLIIQRFYKNLTKDEGYLSHTLPVGVDSHIWGKLIPAVVWNIATSVVVVASILIATGSKEVFDGIAYVWQWFTEFFAAYVQMPLWLFILELCIIVLISTASSIVNFYSAIAIGHLFTKRRVLMSIVAYFGIAFIVSMISSGITGGIWTDLDYSLTNITGGTVTIALAIYALYEVVLCAIYYFITRYIFSRRLNLE